MDASLKGEMILRTGLPLSPRFPGRPASSAKTCRYSWQRSRSATYDRQQHISKQGPRLAPNDEVIQEALTHAERQAISPGACHAVPTSQDSFLGSPRGPRLLRSFLTNLR